MGGNLSATNKTMKIPISSSTLTFSAEATMTLVMPIYYTKDPLIHQELEAAMSVWKEITSNKAQNFVLEKKNNPDFKCALCSEYFYDIFFERLSDVHPGSRGMFSKSGQRMRQYFLASLTMLVALINDHAKFTKTLIHLAHVHNKIGVKAVEYGIVGEVLMYTIHKCCGSTFTPEAHRGWAKLLSRILDGIIPSVIIHEMKQAEGGDSEESLKQSLSRRSNAWGDLSCPSSKSHTPEDQFRAAELSADANRGCPFP